MVSASALTSLTPARPSGSSSREAGAERATTQAQGFGNVVHALADRVGRGDEPSLRAPADDVVDALMAHVDQVWGQIPFRTPWSGGREREEVRARARPVPGLARGPRRARADRPPRAGSRRGRPARRPAGAACTATPTGSSSTPTAGSSSSTSRPARTPRPQAEIAGAPPARALPARRRARRGRRGTSRPAAVPSCGSCGRTSAAAARSSRRTLQEPDDDGVRPIERQLMEAARRLRAEEFPARPGAHCDLLRVRAVLPGPDRRDGALVTSRRSRTPADLRR